MKRLEKNITEASKIIEAPIFKGPGWYIKNTDDRTVAGPFKDKKTADAEVNDWNTGGGGEDDTGHYSEYMTSMSESSEEVDDKIYDDIIGATNTLNDVVARMVKRYNLSGADRSNMRGQINNLRYSLLAKKSIGLDALKHGD